MKELIGAQTRVEDYSRPGDGKLSRRKLFFRCPHGKREECHVLLKPWPINAPTWIMSGPESAPTLSPSINCSDCGWHGFIADGKIEKG